jgi:hypothetical protein
MSDGAHVRSIEALEAFRASLIVYRSKARPALEEIGAEILRTRLWLENDQRVHWENQVRKRTLALEEAKKELFSAEMSTIGHTTSMEIMAVRRAERQLEDARNKLGMIKRWSRDFGSRVDPLARQLEKLQTILSTDLPKAEHFLAQTVKTLDAYANAAVPSIDDAPPSSPTPAGSSPTSAEPSPSAANTEAQP